MSHVVLVVVRAITGADTETGSTVVMVVFSSGGGPSRAPREHPDRNGAISNMSFFIGLGFLSKDRLGL